MKWARLNREFFLHVLFVSLLSKDHPFSEDVVHSPKNLTLSAVQISHDGCSFDSMICDGYNEVNKMGGDMRMPSRVKEYLVLYGMEIPYLLV
jgi:hypothetical protein